MNNKPDPKAKHGIVAMIDALGVRNSTIQESVEFIENIQKILKSLPDFMSGYFEEETEKQKKFQSEPPTLITFGDTFIFSWQMKPEELPLYLPDVGFFLSFVIITGLENRMAFRGAVSVGEYIQYDSTVLGPAIADVAGWYDSPEMIGVIATPRCGQFLNSINEHQGLNSMEFLKYPVPIKGGAKMDLWMAGWPELIDNDNGENYLKNYYNLMQRFQIPKGTEEKYFNTEQFVKFVLLNVEAKPTT